MFRQRRGHPVGGVGGPFQIRFGLGATSEAVCEIIQNLTYQNVSDTPVATRTLNISVTDPTGAPANQPATPYVLLAEASNPFRGVTATDLAFMDLDADGDTDAVFNGSTTQRAFINNGDGGFTEIPSPINPFTVNNDRSVNANLDGDADLETVFAFSEKIGSREFNRHSLIYRDGATQIVLTTELTAGVTIELLDYNGDFTLDIVVIDRNGDTLIYSNDGRGGFTQIPDSQNPFATVSDVSRVGVMDIDGDGDRDFVYVCTTDQTIRVIENRTPATLITVNVTPEPDIPVGTEQNDTLPGTASADLLQGFGGDDLISGAAGNDTLDGGRRE